MLHKYMQMLIDIQKSNSVAQKWKKCENDVKRAMARTLVHL